MADLERYFDMNRRVSWYGELHTALEDASIIMLVAFALTAVKAVVGMFLWIEVVTVGGNDNLPVMLNILEDHIHIIVDGFRVYTIDMMMLRVFVGMKNNNLGKAESFVLFYTTLYF